MRSPSAALWVNVAGVALLAAGGALAVYVARVAVRTRRHTTAGEVCLPSGRHVTIRTARPYDQDVER